jgi:hypothetical protein
MCFSRNTPASWTTRFNEYLDEFKDQYAKLYREPYLDKQGMEPPNPEWANFKRPLNIKSKLEQMKNDNGNRLSYLYFAYRVTSFDTHGKSSKSLFQSAFGKECNFPYLRIEKVLNLIANEYLIIFSKFSTPS